MAKAKLTSGFGKPYVRGDGRWVVPYRPDSASRIEKVVIPRREHIRSDREAIEWAAASVMQRKLDGTLKSRPVPKDGPTIKELSEKWLKLREPDQEISGATYDANRTHMVVHILPAFGDLPITTFEDVLGQKKLADWVRQLKERQGPKGAQTVRNISASLRTFLDWTSGPEAGALLRGNPTRTDWFRRLLPKRQQTDARFATLEDAPLTPAQVQKLLDTKTIELQWRARIALAFTSPLRDGEIAGLRICDVDLDAEIPWIDINKACVLNHREGHAKIGKTKRVWSNRTLPLHPAARDGIKEWIDFGWEEFVGRPPKPSDPVFPRDDGAHGRPRSAEKFRAALELANLPTSVKGTELHFHDSRGCAATWLAVLQVEGRFDGALIRRFLGQSPQGAAERNYFKGNLLAPLAAEQRKITLVWPARDSTANEVHGSEPAND
jgi:integrase